MKEIGKTISGMVKVKLSMLMEIFMMANGLMIKKKVMEKLSIIINGIEYLGSFKDDSIM